MNTQLLRLLLKKSIDSLSDKDLSVLNIEDIHDEDIKSFTEEEAKHIVSKMYHINGNRKYLGERYGIEKAKEVCMKYRSVLAKNISYIDVNKAINSQHHDYCDLFNIWFPNSADNKIIEAAITYWFKDADYEGSNKVYDRFKSD